MKKKSILRNLVIIFIIILFLEFIYLTLNYVIQSKEISYEVLCDNDDDIYVFEDNFEFEIEILDSREELTSYISYGTNENIIESSILNECKVYNISLQEGLNEIYIKIEDNLNNDDFVWSREIYYIDEYEKQFAEELTNNAIQLHLFNETVGDNYEKSLELVGALGVNTIRADFRWQVIENKEGKYDFSYYDKWMEKASNENLKIIATLNGMGNYAGDDLKLNTDEEVIHYLTYAEQLANKYPQISMYEILNEPNYLTEDSAYKTDEDINWYIKIVMGVNEIVNKNKSRDTKVIAGALACVDNDTENYITSQTFLKKLFDNGLYQYECNYSYHPYEWENSKQVNVRLQSLLKEHETIFNDAGGFERQYITEYGKASYSKNNTTENQQADSLVNQSVILDSYNMEIGNIYNFYNMGTDIDNSEDNFGLVRNDYTIKPSYYAMKNYYENTNGSEYIGAINLADGLEAHVYDKDGKPKIITWSNTKDQTIQIDYANFTAKDLYGNDIENTNGKLDITTSPVYLDNISTKYFYEAISNTALEKYSEFEEKFATEIASVEGLQENINTLKQYLESISNIENESEETAKEKMKEHFDLGNQLLTAYKEKELDVEYVKLSSMLDMLNEIGDSFEDLVTVTATTRNPNLENTKTVIDNTEQLINNNADLEIVYPTKILEFSKDLYEDSEYINNLEKENDIKTGLIVSYDLHAKYLVDWANTFANIYVDEYIENNPVTESYSATNWTNQDVTVALNIGEDTNITNNDGSNTHTFTENGTFTFEYERRGQTFTKEITVNIIDKNLPQITNVENGKVYTESIIPGVSDEHLDTVQLKLKGQAIEDYEVGDKLVEKGEYELTATDIAGNVSKVKFYIAEEDFTYKVDNGYITNIDVDTTIQGFMRNFTIIEEYTIKHEGEELSEEDVISTGDILEDTNGSKFILVVKGDLNGDGKINLMDLSTERKYFLSIIEIDEVQELAADMNVDEEVSLEDISIMRKTMLGVMN